MCHSEPERSESEESCIPRRNHFANQKRDPSLVILAQDDIEEERLATRPMKEVVILRCSDEAFGPRQSDKESRFPLERSFHTKNEILHSGGQY